MPIGKYSLMRIILILTVSTRQMSIAPLPIIKGIGKRTIGFSGRPIAEFRGRSIVAPGPPSGATLAVIELLPFPLLILTIDGRSTVDPDILGGFHIASAASGATKGMNMSRFVGPAWGRGCEGIHKILRLGSFY